MNKYYHYREMGSPLYEFIVDKEDNVLYIKLPYQDSWDKPLRKDLPLKLHEVMRSESMKVELMAIIEEGDLFLEFI